MKEPDEFVVKPARYPVATLVMVISAPLITAPEGSLIVPTMLPVLTVVCAIDRGTTFNVKRRVASATRKRSAGLVAAAIMM